MEVSVDDKHKKNAPDIDWQDIVFGKQGEGIQLIERLAQRRFNDGPLSGEAANYVIDNISKDNWKRCAQFKGNANANTFARRIIINLLEEFSRKRFGRPRPPAWLNRQGELWVKIWKELCLERQLLPTLIDRYTNNNLYDVLWVKKVATIIRARIPNCGQIVHDLSPVDNHYADNNQNIVENISHSFSDSDGFGKQDFCGYSFEQNAETEVFLIIKAILDEELAANFFDDEKIDQVKSAADSYSEQFNKLHTALNLSNEEIIILRMVYRDGLSKSVVAKSLGVSCHKINLKIKKAFTRIYKAIEVCDLDFDSMLKKL